MAMYSLKREGEKETEHIGFCSPSVSSSDNSSSSTNVTGVMLPSSADTANTEDKHIPKNKNKNKKNMNKGTTRTTRTTRRKMFDTDVQTF